MSALGATCAQYAETRQSDRITPAVEAVIDAEPARRVYHDLSRNQAGLEDYIARLRAADALIVQFPVWSFGMPAMLKGYFDRVWAPLIRRQ